MGTTGGRQDPALGVDDDLRQLEERLQVLGEELIARSQLPGQDAIDLFRRGTTLHQAAFALRTERAAEIDLRDAPGS